MKLLAIVPCVLFLASAHFDLLAADAKAAGTEISGEIGPGQEGVCGIQGGGEGAGVLVEFVSALRWRAVGDRMCEAGRKHLGRFRPAQPALRAPPRVGPAVPAEL